MNKKKNIKEIAFVFFKLGCFAFGGPAAHIAMMQEEVVEKRKWLSRQYFLDLMGATNLIPGPNSTEMTMHCGHERGGKLGLFVAGICFIFPAIIITGSLAYLYTEYGKLPYVEPFMYGIKSAVLAIILNAIFKLGGKAIKNWKYMTIGLCVVLFSLLGFNEIFILLSTGLLGLFYFYLKNKTLGGNAKSILPFILLNSSLATTKVISSLKIFWVFLKVGAVLYGSGYVLFAYLDAELVEKGWLTQQQLLDAVAIGQFTPGPVLSTATFIGYQLNGFSGALMASVGIFLPSFLFVLILNPLINKIRNSVLLSGFLDAVNVAAVGIMVAVLLKMGDAILLDWKSVIIALTSVILVFLVKKTNAIWIILTGAGMGYLFTFF
jgi:chromate transporter